MDQLGGPRRIGVDVTGDVQPLLPGLGEHLQHPGHRPAPVAPSDGLQVADLHRGAEVPGHGEHLGQGFHHAVPLLAHVDGDGHTGIPQGFQGPDESGGVVKALGRVA